MASTSCSRSCRKAGAETITDLAAAFGPDLSKLALPVDRLLEGMLRAYSPTGAIGPVVDHLWQALPQLGLQPSLDKAGNLVADIGTGPVRVALVGHVDTVPGVVPVRREGQLLFGRGAVDAKGPFAAFCAAASLAAAAEPSLSLKVIGCKDEEGPSLGAQGIDPTYQPHHGIVGEPSGARSITLGYKGMVRLVYERSTESAHSSDGEKPNALDDTLTFWNRLLAFHSEHTVHDSAFESLQVSPRSMTTTDDGLAMRASLRVDFRLPPGFDLQTLQSFAQKYRMGGTLQWSGATPPVVVEKNTPLVRAFVRAIRDEGGDPTFKKKTGTADLNELYPRWKVPMVAYGPGDSSLDHTPHEHITLAELEEGTRVLTRVLVALGRRGAAG